MAPRLAQLRPAPMAPLSQQSPEELAVRAQAGGGPAASCFGELVNRYETRLFNFLLRRTRSRSDAEELTQEAFTRAWERIESYDPAWKFSTWLYTIASRLAVSKHRRQSREQVWHNVEGAVAHAGLTQRWESEQHEHDDVITDRVEDRRLGTRLWHLAQRELGPVQRTALWLRYAEDMNIGEIATVMGKSQVGVRVLLFRARQALATSARSRGDFPEWATDASAIPDSPEVVTKLSSQTGGVTQ